MDNYIKNIDRKDIKKFIKIWTAQNHSARYRVVCEFDNKAKDVIKVEAKIFDGLISYLFSDNWTFDDNFALVQSPHNTEVIKSSWKYYVLHNLKKSENQGKKDKNFNAVKYLKMLDVNDGHMIDDSNVDSCDFSLDV